MKKQSAGIMLYRQVDGEYHVLLVHPGGPFWAKKEVGAWSIPKGEVEQGEDMLAAAQREFAEELGLPVPAGTYTELGSAEQSNKTVTAWALGADLDLTDFKSMEITIDWPPKSGKQIRISEIDRAAWLRLPEAQLKIVPGQLPLLDALVRHLGITADPPHVVPLPGDAPAASPAMQPPPAANPVAVPPQKTKKHTPNSDQTSLF